MRTKFQTPWLAAIFVLALTAAALAPHALVADEVNEAEAKTFLVSLSERAIHVAQDAEATQEDRETRIRLLLEEGFDVPIIARFVLGRHWRAASKEQQRDFMTVFEDVLVRQTLVLFGKYSGETIDIQAVGPDRANPKLVAVASSVDRPNGAKVKVDWRLLKRKTDYKIIDIVAEGVSMAMALRSEYSSVIQSSSIDGLIEQLRKKAT